MTPLLIRVLSLIPEALFGLISVNHHKSRTRRSPPVGENLSFPCPFQASKTGAMMMMMMMTFITQRGESQGKTNKERKATKSRGRGLEEGARRALMRQHGEEGCGERG